MGRRRSFGVIEKELKFFGEWLGVFGGPGGVDEVGFDDVAEMHAVFVSPGDEFHADEGFDADEVFVSEGDGFADGGGGDGVLGADMFIGENEVDAVAGFGSFSVKKHVEVCFSAEDGDAAVDEAIGFEGGFEGLEVGSLDEEIDVAGVADEGFVDLSDPGGYGVSADDGVGNVFVFEDGGDAFEAFFDLAEGVVHFFPRVGFDGGGEVNCHGGRG